MFGRSFVLAFLFAIGLSACANKPTAPCHEEITNVQPNVPHPDTPLKIDTVPPFSPWFSHELQGLVEQCDAENGPRNGLIYAEWDEHFFYGTMDFLRYDLNTRVHTPLFSGARTYNAHWARGHAAIVSEVRGSTGFVSVIVAGSLGKPRFSITNGWSDERIIKGNYTYPSWTDDNRLCYIDADSVGIPYVHFDGRRYHVNHVRPVESRISPDGKYIALISENILRYSRLYIVDVLTQRGYWLDSLAVHSLNWTSVPGEMVISRGYGTDSVNGMRIWRINITTGKSLQLTTEAGRFEDMYPSQDDRGRVFFVRRGATIEGSELFYVTDKDVYSDGRIYPQPVAYNKKMKGYTDWQ